MEGTTTFDFWLTDIFYYTHYFAVYLLCFNPVNFHLYLRVILVKLSLVVKGNLT